MIDRKAFTLIELLIVVVVLGVLASITLPSISNAVTKSQVASAANDIKTIAKVVKKHYLDHGTWAEDAVDGVAPPEYEDYLINFDWTKTPVGGAWDYENWTQHNWPMDIGITISRGNENKLQAVDALIDNGDLSVGNAYANQGNFHYIIVPNTN